MCGNGKSRKMKIGIVVDNPRRDLRGLVLLAYLFSIRGCRVYLIPMYQQGYDIPQLKLDLLIANYVRESNRDLLQDYKKLGIRVAVLDTEGGILSESGQDSPITWATTLRQSGMGRLVDYYCFWGEAVRTAFEIHSGIASENLVVTGCPRYDVCAEPWSAVLNYSRRNHILFNTNFSAINPAYTKSAEDEQRIFESLGWDKEYVENLFADLRTVFPLYLNNIEAVAKAFPERLVQVRPHPFESNALYDERFKGIPNIVVDAEGDILNAIANADCTVHLNCGSSVDALWLGKVPISMEYLNTERLRAHAPLPSTLSCAVVSQEMLIELIGDPIARAAAYDVSQAQKKVDPWYYKNDGLASQRVVDFLIAGMREASLSNVRISEALMTKKKRPLGKWQRLQKLTSFLTGTFVSSRISEWLQPHRIGKRISLQQVSKLLDAYAICSGGSHVNVSRARAPHTGLPLASFKIDGND